MLPLSLQSSPSSPYSDDSGSFEKEGQCRHHLEGDKRSTGSVTPLGRRSRHLLVRESTADSCTTIAASFKADGEPPLLQLPRLLRLAKPFHGPLWVEVDQVIARPPAARLRLFFANLDDDMLIRVEMTALRALVAEAGSVV